MSDLKALQFLILFDDICKIIDAVSDEVLGCYCLSLIGGHCRHRRVDVSHRDGVLLRFLSLVSIYREGKTCHPRLELRF